MREGVGRGRGVGVRNVRGGGMGGKPVCARLSKEASKPASQPAGYKRGTQAGMLCTLYVLSLPSTTACRRGLNSITPATRLQLAAPRISLPHS